MGPPPRSPLPGPLLLAAVRSGALAVAAVAGDVIVGLAVAAPTVDGDHDELLCLTVAPPERRHGLATRILERLVAAQRERRLPLVALVTVAERDPVEPLPVEERRRIAARVLTGAGFQV